MTLGTTLAFGMLVLCIALESCVRLYRWRLAPLRLRLLYAFCLLNQEAVRAITEIHQRTERARGRSLDDLFVLYSAASGRPRREIERLFGFGMSWRQLLTSRLMLRYHLRWHAGLVPIPDQRLRTVTIRADGTRSNGALRTDSGDAAVSRVVLTGGSVAYGYGATSDETTIAARLCHHLNEGDPRPGHRWEVVNRAFPAATSFQELIVVLQTAISEGPAVHVVSLSGCNDVDQQFSGGVPNVSALAQGYTNSLQGSGVLAVVARAARNRSALLGVAGRFIAAYRLWPDPSFVANATAQAGPPIRDQIDRPDMYPLW